MYEILAERVDSLEGSFLVLHQLPEGESFEEEMLAHNEIPGIAGMRTMILAGEKMRQYRIDGCRSLRESLLGQKLSGEEFRRLMSLLFYRIAEGRRYLLREESFVLRPDCLFLSQQSGEPVLVYCPEYEKPLPDQMRELSDWLLGYLDAQDAQAVYSGYAFHVLSHESGSNMQRMLTAVSGSDVPGLPSREMSGSVPYAGEPAAVLDCATASDAAAAGESGGTFRRKWMSFFGGLTVIIGMLTALAWAMR